MTEYVGRGLREGGYRSGGLVVLDPGTGGSDETLVGRGFIRVKPRNCRNPTVTNPKNESDVNQQEQPTSDVADDSESTTNQSNQPTVTTTVS